MTLEISNNRRIFIKAKVLEVLQQFGIPELPVKIGAIIRKITYIKLITYSSQIKRYGITYNELILNAETKDSYVVKDKATNRFCIYYNDIDIYIVSSNRVRWNLAHELGHIFLDHHNMSDSEKLFRYGLSDEEYNYYETEADYFAQLILVPHAALAGFRIANSNAIKILCKISEPASKKRYYDYMVWRNHITNTDAYDNSIFHFYYNYIYKRRCKHCNASLIQRYGKHCPICGNKTLEWGDGKMIYESKYQLDENSKAIKCPKCNNEQILKEGDYCHICGTYLINRCDDREYSDIPFGNEPCGRLLPANARYCPHCGNASTYYKDKLLCSWEYYSKATTQSTFSKVDIDDELPFS